MDLLKYLKSNWILIAFIGSLVIGWTTFNSRLASAEIKITELQVVVAQINQIQVDIAVIKQDITWIKKNVK